MTSEKHKLGLDYMFDDSPVVYKQWIDSKNNPDNFFLTIKDYNKHINVKNKVNRLIDIIKILN